MQTLERDRLINDYLDYTGALAAGLMSEFSLHGVVGYDDVLGYATIGLTTAALRYQADRGAHFKTFSFRHIRGAVLDGVRVLHRGRLHHQHWKVSTGQLSERSAPLPLGDKGRGTVRRFYLEHPDQNDVVLDPFPAFDDALALRQALDTLPEIERQIIVLHYFEDLTDVRVAKRLGYSRTFVVRHRKLALQALATALVEERQ
jgi:RNA polymerase sigma factor (sigma-70 family)